MKRDDFEKSIREAFSLLVKIELSSWDRQISLRCLEPHPEFRRVAYSAETSYQDVFKAGLRYRAYNFVLHEFSYFQFWHDSKHEARVLRYAYYTNPFDIAAADQSVSQWCAAESIINCDDLYQQVLDDSHVVIGKPPIRYDLDLDGHRESIHPCAHLTVGAHMNNRWPVARVLTPKLFVLFICKHYYPDFWTKMDRKTKSTEGFTNTFDQTLADEKRASLSLGKVKFTQKEKLHPFVD